MKTAVKSITGGTDLLMCHLLLAWSRFTQQFKSDKLQEASTALEAKLVEEVEKARIAVEEDLGKAQINLETTAAELDDCMQQLDEAKGKMPALIEQVEAQSCTIEDLDKQIGGFSKELEQSRRKAKDINDELGKVGIFLNNHTPRKNSRSGSRPHSGNSKNSDGLPKIDGSNSRPISGNNKGSKSARGVAGESR